MSEYKADDLLQDTKQYMTSQLGAYHLDTLTQMLNGYLSAASNMESEHPDRYLAKYNALKEFETFILSPLGNDTPARDHKS